ncbi:MAG: glycosyltransferase family 39 protein [Sedimentisphaerales bacterium]|nr:glycosyltransferase family 39 protein [Sedimentisphaerales bacterium]
MREKVKNLDYQWIKAILISAGFAILYLLIAGSSTLWDRDEPRYARVTVEMIESGNYLVPTFNGQPWPDKPILLYWLMSLPVRLLGPTEIACRFFGVMGTTITLLLTFFIGKKLFNAKAGLWSETILATTLLMMFVGSSALVDGVLLPFIVGTMAVFVGRIGERIRPFDFLVAGLLMGIGMLAKGPAGLLPVFVIVVVLWFGRRNYAEFVVNLVGLALSVIIAIGIFLAWAVPANKEMDGELFRVFLGHHILARTLRPMESHGGNFILYLPYYSAIIIAGFFPWTAFLPGAFSAIIGKRIGIAGARNIVLSWIVVTVILMTLAATKLPHYILFAWPAMAVMVGGTIAAGKDILSERDKKWLRGGVWFLLPVGLGLASGLILAGYALKVESLKLPGLICGLAIIIMTGTCVFLQIREKFVSSARTILAGIAVFLAPMLFGFLPAVEEIKISPSIAKAVREKTGTEAPVATYKFAEPTLNFYIGRTVTRLRNENEVVDWLNGTAEGVLIIPKKDLNGIMQKSGHNRIEVDFEEIVSKEGINYSKGAEKLEVTAILSKKQASK